MKRLHNIMLLCAFAAALCLTLSGPASAASITGEVPNGKVGESYFYFSLRFESNSFGIETWSVSDGALPPGLKLNSNFGGINGTPTRAGTFNFTLLVTSSSWDGGTETATRSFTVTIEPSDNSSQPTINYSFKNGTVGTPYSDYLMAGDGTSPYTWSYSGTLPPGLSLRGSDTANTGDNYTLSGTPTSGGNYSFTVTLTDTYGGTATKSFTVSISGGSGTPSTPTPSGSLTINYDYFDGTAGVPYNGVVRATGGTAPFTWSVSSGSLPEGLYLSPSGSLAFLKGTPTSAGTYNFTIKVRDSAGNSQTKSFEMTIEGYTAGGDSYYNELAITSNTNLTSGYVGTAYRYNFTANASGVIWSVYDEDELPPGLTLSEAGVLSGTPTRAGTYEFEVSAETEEDSTSERVTITISSSASPAPTSTDNQAPTTGSFKINYSYTDGMVGLDYYDLVIASGGTGTYTWEGYNGNLPPGLALYSASSSAILKGTPTQAGNYKFSLTASDSSGGTATQEYTVTITEELAFNGKVDSSGTVGKTFSGDIKAFGGKAPYTWEVIGNLPDGVNLVPNGSSATLRGTPTKAGTYSFSLGVSVTYPYYGGDEGTNAIRRQVTSDTLTLAIAEQGSSSGTGGQDGSTSSNPKSISTDPDSKSNTASKMQEDANINSGTLTDEERATLNAIKNKVSEVSEVRGNNGLANSELQELKDTVKKLVDDGVKVSAGCDTGFSALGLAFAALFLLRRKS